VALDRLRHQALLADAGEEHRHRHLAFAKPRDLDLASEIGRGVVDGVLDVVSRHLDRQADAVLADLLDRGRRRSHRGH
jgi:hypothetical protein